MKKYTLALLLSLFPVLAAAAESPLGFKPPAGDYSVIFLGNIFGVVDGVLHGTGSQIMGSMFTVFNAAVLALGGIIIMYTLLVSTMNTAQEGQFLGQKWSSLWVPVRTTFGLALLIPKASGYCLMQIFVMWIIVQGIGAADKVWNAALSYLNRGGVIIQEQPNPTKALTSSRSAGIATGVQTILAGQVCMLGIQKQLEAQREIYMRQKQDKIPSACYEKPTKEMEGICNAAVPNFINSVNIVSIQNANPKAAEFSVDMPNFTNPPYSKLNGICGTIRWSAFSMPEDRIKSIETITSNDIQTAKMSRAIAIQQVYLDMALVAQVMVNNNPSLKPKRTDEQKKNDVSIVAQDQFGVPKTMAGRVCDDSTVSDCYLWGSVPGSTAPVLFNGTEFQGAIADYNGIMLPTLNLIRQSENIAGANASRRFIKEATNRGWIMAGSYFFNLVNLNQAARAPDLMDEKTGLEKSSFSPGKLLVAFTEASPGTYNCTSTYPDLCYWLNKDQNKVRAVVGLIQGGIGNISLVSEPQLKNLNQNVVKGIESSTVYGFTTNSTIIRVPGQPGITPLRFADMMNVTMPKVHPLPHTDFPCGELKIAFFSICLGQLLGNIFYNLILVNLYNAFLVIFQPLFDQVIFSFLLLPLQGMSSIFRGGMKILSEPGVNPIVALANMGTYYINFAAELWQRLIELSIAAAILPPPFGIVIFAFLALSLPVVLAWLSIMVMIGFFTAYYIPVLPYMIFTFGSIAWLIVVIEAMVAAPIVALGVTHPEGHEAFGKGEQAIMILMNVFLRPSMMIIGYISGIALSYVGVWILNAGFDTAIGFMQGSEEFGTKDPRREAGLSSDAQYILNKLWPNNPLQTQVGVISGGYEGWSGIFAYFFSILIYTMMYLIIVQRAFTLISYLPDRVLRWIGGQPEGIGQEAAQWGEEAKSKLGEAGKDIQAARAAGDKAITGYGVKGVNWAKEKLGGAGGGQVQAQGNTPEQLGGSEGEEEGSSGSSTPPPGGGGGGGASGSGGASGGSGAGAGAA